MRVCHNVKNKAIEKAQRIVVKVGSSLLINKNSGELDYNWFQGFIKDIVFLQSLGKEIIIVSSGAIALGKLSLSFNMDHSTPNDKTENSAYAAVGQIELAYAYKKALQEFQIPVGLVLLTTHNTEVRSMYLNLRDTVDKMLEGGAIPVVNENDAVSDIDDCYGDNDRLAARISGMASADLLILLSDIDGLYTDNPRDNPKADFIPYVDNVTSDVLKMASGVGSDVGTGGMRTKLAAAIIARSAGCDMIIANGKEEKPIHNICDNQRHTFFSAGEYATTARKHWILGTPEPTGSVTVDAGAVQALIGGSSLLSVGIVQVDGHFIRGDCICILDPEGKEIAKGLASYDKDEIFMILGRQTKDISKLLGYIRKPEVVHRNDMVVTIL